MVEANPSSELSTSVEETPILLAEQPSLHSVDSHVLAWKPTTSLA